LKLFIKKNDVKAITGLQGYNLFNHQRRKRCLIKLILQTLAQGSTILDVGCASGDIATELSFLGFQVHGIDFEPSRLNNAKNLAAKYSQAIQFEHKSMDGLSGERKYDGILLGEVLEHFPNPTRILIKLKEFLTPQGQIIITAPNMPSLRNRLKFGLFGIFPDNNPEHKFYFDFRRFLKVVSDARYQVLYIRSRFTHLFATSEIVAYIENLMTSWFSYFFSKSGDTLFAVILPKG